MTVEQEKTVRPRGTDSAKVIQVIETRSIEGRGTVGDPCRNLIQYWKFDGNILTELYENGGRYEANEQEEPVRPRGTDSARVIQVIETRSIEGRGTLDDPCQTLIQYWEFGGNLLTALLENGGRGGIIDEQEPVRPRGTDSARVIQLIETRSIEGRGTPDDPCRTLIQYWEFDGNLLTERYED